MGQLFSPKLRDEASMSNLITFMQHPTGVLTSVIRQEKEIEGTHIKQEERKPSLFDITINVEKITKNL